jgi:molybdopterin molybdotransferase
MHSRGNAVIQFDEALTIALDHARPVEAERVKLTGACGRVLAEDVAADMDMPPFNKSAMDGYACRREDLGRELRVLETIPAGQPPTKPVGPGQCSKIMTGAEVPEGADCVIMVEFTEEAGEDRIRFTGEKTQDNVCLRGEDLETGQVVLRRGTLIHPEEVAVLATVGCAEPPVARMARLGIISTGDEIVEPSVKPGPSQIRNSNSYQLLAQARRMCVAPTYYGVAADTRESLDELIGRALDECDVVMLSGGVSMGEFDLVPEVLRKNGVEILYDKVATKPGRPTTFGKSDRALVFGLPGNPVSTFVLFEVLVKPVLYRMMGHEFRPREFRARLDKTVRQRKIRRVNWIPVVLTTPGSVCPVEYHGSAHSGALCGADGLIRIPAGSTEIQAGSDVDVRPLQS